MHRYRNYHCAVNVRAHFLWHYDSVTVCSSDPVCPNLRDSLDYWLTAQQDVEAQNYEGLGGTDPCDGSCENKCNYRAKLMASLLSVFYRVVN